MWDDFEKSFDSFPGTYLCFGSANNPEDRDNALVFHDYFNSSLLITQLAIELNSNIIATEYSQLLYSQKISSCYWKQI